MEITTIKNRRPKNSLNPLIESALFRRLSWLTRIREGWHWAGMGDEPELLLTEKECAQIVEYIASLRPAPVQTARLSARMKAFASTFHFAFGDKNNRDIAIAMWVRALSGYPEAAIKITLDELTASYDGVKPLVPGLAITHIKKLIAKDELYARKYRQALKGAILFKDEAGKEEYLATRQQAKHRVEEEKAAFAAKLEEMALNRRCEEAKQEYAREIARRNLKADRQAQLERMKALAATLHDNARAMALVTEFEDIVARS